MCPKCSFSCLVCRNLDSFESTTGHRRVTLFVSPACSDLWAQLLRQCGLLQCDVSWHWVWSAGRNRTFLLGHFQLFECLPHRASMFSDYSFQTFRGICRSPKLILRIEIKEEYSLPFSFARQCFYQRPNCEDSFWVLRFCDGFFLFRCVLFSWRSDRLCQHLGCDRLQRGGTFLTRHKLPCRQCRRIGERRFLRSRCCLRIYPTQFPKNSVNDNARPKSVKRN